MSPALVCSLQFSAIMEPFLIVYASREGQTQRIAEHVAATLCKHGAVAQVVNAAEPSEGLNLAQFGAVILAAFSAHAKA